MSSKPAIVLIHGMWSTPQVFDELKAEFQSLGLNVYLPTLPYHFSVDEMTPPILNKLTKVSFDEYVESVVNYVKPLGSNLIILGHSMGGLIAQKVASQISCRGLILLSSAAPAGINGWSWSVIKTFGRNLFKFPLWRKTTFLSAESIRYGIANGQPESVQKHVCDTATFESGRVTWQLGMSFLYRHPKNKINYANVSCPILILGGGQDKITPLKIQHRLKEKYAEQAELVIIPSACHWTVGGIYFTQIKEAIMSWFEKNQMHTSKNSNDSLDK